MQRSSYDVDAEASSNFRRNVKRLAKRFPNIEADLQDFLQQSEKITVRSVGRLSYLTATSLCENIAVSLVT